MTEELILAEFDITGIKEFTEDDLLLLSNTLGLIKESLSQDLTLLADLVDKSNYKQTKSMCHKLKPNFELLGLVSISMILNQIEQGDFEEEEAYSQIQLIIRFNPILRKLIDEEISKLDY